MNKKAHLSRKFVERFEREKKILTLLKNDKKTPDIVNRMIPSSSVIQNWSSLKASQTITSIFSYLRERVTTEQFKEIQKSFGTNTTCFDKVFIQKLGEMVRDNQNQALIALWEFIVRDLDSTIDNVFSLEDEVEPLVLAAEHERNKMIFKQILEEQNENTKAQLIRAWMSDPLNAKALSGIDEVVLVNKNLKVFPEEIPRFFKNLRYLFLVDNKIESLPKEIVSLKNLKVLYISKNFCSELPEGFSKLKNLTYLDFDNNCLKELPEEISTLKNLEVISVQNNRLKTLPCLERLENLQDLWISGNRLVGQEVNIETLGKWKVKVHC